MRQKILLQQFLCLLITSFLVIGTSYGQKTKREEIYKNKLYKEYMDANYYYDDNNNINSTQIMLYAQDLRYQHIVELTTIYFGSPHDLLKFIIDVEKFANENEADVSNTIDGRRVNIVEQMGIKGFTIYEKDGSGYKVFTFKNWRKIKEALIEWAEEKNVSLE